MTIIVLDPGHGGSEPAGKSTPYGGRGRSGLLEKDLVLELSKRVADRLGEREVVLTRTSDRNLPLAERIAIAARFGARTFVSLHAGHGRSDGHGPEVWVHSSANDDSLRLAHRMARAMRTGTGAPRVSQGPLAVLDPGRFGARVAACLVALDNLDDPELRDWLRYGGLDDMAARIADGLPRYGGFWSDLFSFWGPKNGLRPMQAFLEDLVRRRSLKKSDAHKLPKLKELAKNVAKFDTLKPEDQKQIAVDVFHAVCFSGLDVRGQQSCVWGAEGRETGLNAGIDIGQLIAPSFLNAKLTLKGSRAYSKESMLVLRRMAGWNPKILTPTMLAPKVTLMVEETPVNLAFMEGSRSIWRIGGGAALGVGLPEILQKLDIGKASLGVTAKAEITASADAIFDRVELVATDPHTYRYSDGIEELAPEVLTRILKGPPEKVNTDQFSKLCFLSLTGHAGKTQRKAEAGTSISINKVKLSASANKGRRTTEKYTTYRHQIWQLGVEHQASHYKQPSPSRIKSKISDTKDQISVAMVSTQDCLISYSQTDTWSNTSNTSKYELKDIDMVVPSRDKPTGKTRRVLNTLSYLSGHVYWRHPNRDVDYPQDKRVQALVGTGLALGTSVPCSVLEMGSSGLRQPRQARSDKQNAAIRLLNVVADGIQVPIDKLREFVKEIGDKSLIPPWSDLPFVDSLLFEARFRAPCGYTVGFTIDSKTKQMLLDPGFAQEMVKCVRTISDPNENKDTWDFTEPSTEWSVAWKEWKTWKLQSLSLRYRLADQEEAKDTFFKLGFRSVIGIELANVRSAGASAVIDLYTKHYSIPEKECPPKGRENGALKPDFRVPPVSLLHQ